MKLSEKTKKYLAISGGVVVCIGLITAISLQFGKAPAGEDYLPSEGSGIAEIVVDPSSLASTEESTRAEESSTAEPGTEESSTEEKKVVIQPNTETAADSRESSQPVDTRPAQTDRTEQSIQPEVTKPAEPSEEVKRDATQKPDGTKVKAPPTPVEHDTYTPPEQPETTPDQPQGGDTQDGKVYLPGFGWVTDTGSSGTTAEDMYENGNKIGDMGN